MFLELENHQANSTFANPCQPSRSYSTSLSVQSFESLDGTAGYLDNLLQSTPFLFPHSNAIVIQMKG